MANYGETKEILLKVLKDGKWYKINELQKKCEDYGLNFNGEKGKAPLYTSLYQLKKKGEIECDSRRFYRKCEKRQSNTMNEGQEKKENSEKDEKLQEAIEIIEITMEECKNFDWFNCSNEELQKARCAVKQIKNLLRKMQDDFKI